MDTAVGPDDPPLAGQAITGAEALPDSEGVIRAGRLAGRTMWSAIWILALPVLVQQTMAACVGMFDKIIAGDLPDDIVVAAMDGLGVGSYIGWFIGIAMTGVGIGGQALIARAMGAGRLGEGRAALGQAITLAFIWGFAVGAVLWLLAPPLAATCNMTEAAATYLIEYVRMLAYSMPLCGVMMVGGMCLHGAGETVWPSLIAVLVNVVNVVASWILSGADITVGDWVLVNPFAFDLHVAGIAAGSSISYVAGGLATLAILVRGVKDLDLRRAALRPERTMMWRIVRIGIPSFCEGISMWAVNLFVLQFIGIIGARAGDGAAGEGLQGAHIIAIQWEAFSFMPGFAIGTAAGALAGQYLGAGSASMAMRAVIRCTILGVGVMGSLGIVFMLFGETLTSIVSDEPVHLEYTPRLLAICGAMQVFFAITMVFRQGLRGVGDTKWTFILTTVSSYGVRLPAAYLLGVHFGLGLPGIWYGLCGEFAVRSALFAGRFFQGGWKRIEV